MRAAAYPNRRSAREGALDTRVYKVLQSPATIAQWGALATFAGLLCASIVLPAIHIADDLPWVKAEQAFLPFVFLGYVWFLFAGFARTIRPNAMWVVGAIFSVCIATSIWYGADVLHHPVLFRDYYEIPKAMLPVVFYTIGFEAKLTPRFLNRLWQSFSVAIFIVCLYAWAQFLNLGFTYALNTLYSGGEHIDNGLLLHGRVYSTMGNANVLGQLMTWAIAGFLLLFLFRVGNRAINLALIFASSITLAMTGSRYGLITAVLAIVFSTALSLRTSRVRGSNLALLALAVPVVAILFAVTTRTNPGNTERLASLRHPLQADSLRARLDSLWLDAEKDIAQSPIFGYGPAKIFYTGVFTDSEYLDVMKEFGSVGLIAYLAYYFIPMWKLRFGLSPNVRRRHNIDLATISFAVVVGLTALAMNFGESTFYNQLLQASVWMWLGLGVQCATRPASVPAFLTVADVSPRLASELTPTPLSVTS